MISHTEGTDRVIDPATGALAESYRVCFKGQGRPQHIIQSLATHPAVSGEWKGESLDFLGAQYVGKISTAAGRYQIRKRTFLELAAILGTNSYVEEMQDDMGILLVKRRGALAFVNAGDLKGAILACDNEWASFPGGTSHQPEHTFEYLRDFYTAAGGALA